MFPITVIAVSLALLLAGCDEDFAEVDAGELKAELDLAVHSDVISWWYIGEKDGYYYLVEKKLWEEKGFRISKDYVAIDVGVTKAPSSDESEWMNLKERDISFKTGYPERLEQPEDTARETR